MGGRRDGMHYRTQGGRSGERTSRNAHAARDAAYRAALGIGDDGPMPKALGNLNHQRPEYSGDYLA